MNSLIPQSGEPEPGAGYTLEILASMTGTSLQAVMQYWEHGIISPVSAEDSLFDDEAVRMLRRAEHLRGTCGMNLAGLKLLTGLLSELEQLRSELRSLRG